MRFLVGIVFLLGTATAQAVQVDGNHEYIYFSNIGELRHKAELGSVSAQFSMGWLYIHETEDVPVPYSPKRAVYWYKKAAQQGYSPAAFNLAVIYGQGRGVQADKVAAFAWLEFAAREGHKRSKDLLPGLREELSDRDIKRASELQERWLPRRLLTQQ